METINLDAPPARYYNRVEIRGMADTVRELVDGVEVTTGFKPAPVIATAWQVIENNILVGYVDAQGQPYKPPRKREEHVVESELESIK